MHYRKEIRNAFVAFLMAANIPRTEGKIYNFRLAELENHNVPSLSVYVTGEQASKQNETPRMHARTVSVVVEVRDSHSDDNGTLVDSVDDLCNFVEQAILDDPFLGTYEDDGVWSVEDTTITGTDYGFDNGGDKYAMHATITFDVKYTSLDSVEMTELSDLVTITHKTVQGVEDDNDTTGTITYD